MTPEQEKITRSASALKRDHLTWSRREDRGTHEAYANITPLLKPGAGLLSTHNSDDMGLMSFCTRMRKANAREVLFYKGDPATHVYIVMSGRVKVSAPSEEGKEITFAILGPGELIGEIGTLEATDHSATVTTLEPSEFAVLSHEDFNKFVVTYPGFTLKLVGILSTRLRKASEMAENIFFLSLPARLAKKLVELVECYGEPTNGGVRIGVHLCQQELANLVGTSRESVNKQLGAWQAADLVRLEQGYVVITELDALASLTKVPPPARLTSGQPRT